MKIWNGYGSEHSMNLVMIGRFEDATDAIRAKEVIDRLTEQVNSDIQAGLTEVGVPTDRYTDGMLDLLGKQNLPTILPAEAEQFGVDVNVRVEGNAVVLTTDESDVSSFLKVLLHEGARIEVFSAHVYPDTEYGRGR